MARRTRKLFGTAALQRSVGRVLRQGQKAMNRAVQQAVTSTVNKSVKASIKAAVARHSPPQGTGTWSTGLAMGVGGMRRYRLYRPPGLGLQDRVPLMVMLHGCAQDAASFAASTRMHRLADRDGFCVLYPEQDRLANAQGCWNWFDTRHGRAQAEAAVILNAIDQVSLLSPIDPQRVAVAGLSAGASMAALLGTRHPERFRAVVMHSGVPPGLASSGLSAVGAMRGHARATAAPEPHDEPTAPSPLPWPALLVIHGDADTVVSLRNAHTAIAQWVAHAGANARAAREVQRGQRRPMTVTDHVCGRRTVITLVEVSGLGHAWSGGAARQPFSDPTGPDASRLAWAFASKQWGD